MDGEPANINPRLAADLGKPLSEQQAVDLSKQAVAGRKVKGRLEAAGKWARAMNRTFKGIRGSHTRRGYVQIAIERNGLTQEDADLYFATEGRNDAATER